MTRWARSAQASILNVLRAWDRTRAIKPLPGLADAAQAALAEARGKLPALRRGLDEAVAAERQAEDKSRKAAGHHAECKNALHRAERDDTDPEAETQARMLVVQASETARNRGEAHEAAIAARQKAEAKLAEAEAGIRTLEDAEADAARRAENLPARVPMSATTGSVAHPFFVYSQQDAAGTEGAGAARLQALAIAEISGLENELLNQGRKEGRTAAQKEQDDFFNRRTGYGVPGRGVVTSQ